MKDKTGSGWREILRLAIPLEDGLKSTVCFEPNIAGHGLVHIVAGEVSLSLSLSLSLSKAICNQRLCDRSIWSVLTDYLYMRVYSMLT